LLIIFVYKRKFWPAPPKEGKYLTTEGLWITSTFKNGEAEGFGKILFPGGSTYKGEIVAGRAHGKGVFLGYTAFCFMSFNPCDWGLECKYEGEFERSRPHGFG